MENGQIIVGKTANSPRATISWKARISPAALKTENDINFRSAVANSTAVPLQVQVTSGELRPLSSHYVAPVFVGSPSPALPCKSPISS